jgi:hypothetical protein
MKKVVSILMALTCALVLAGCGAGSGVVVDPNAQAANGTGVVQQPGQPGASSPAQESSLFFETNGIKIRPYDLAEGVLSKLGKPNDTFEAPSCAFQGTDKFYYYSGFQLTVNDIDGADHISIITISDDTVSIPQGVKIGETQDAMLESMGNSMQECGGLYLLTEGTTTLQIQVKDGKVSSILYLYGSTQACPPNVN